MRTVLLLAASLALLPGSAPAARFVRSPAPSGPSLVEHSFGGAAPAFRLELRRIPGRLHRVRGSAPRLADVADYSDAGRLVARRDLAIGPLEDGPAFVPAGEYSLSLAVSGPEGLPVLGLASADGLRLRIPLVSAPRPARPPEALELVSLGEAGAEVSVPLAIHLPTASGLLMIGPAQALRDSPLARRRSRSEVIQDEIQRRALESGHHRSLRRRDER